ncbi:hypothetical protein BH09PAT2_BH09PAT2_02400 [soil metagenome]
MSKEAFFPFQLPNLTYQQLSSYSDDSPQRSENNMVLEKLKRAKKRYLSAFLIAVPLLAISPIAQNSVVAQDATPDTGVCEPFDVMLPVIQSLSPNNKKNEQILEPSLSITNEITTVSPMLVPVYFLPTNDPSYQDNQQWTNLINNISHKQGCIVDIIINPANGPTPKIDSIYANFLDNLGGSAKTYGYLNANYCQSTEQIPDPVAHVEEQLLIWETPEWDNRIDNYFVDITPGEEITANQECLQQIITAVRTADPDAKLITNPGTTPQSGLSDEYNQVDGVVCQEGSYEEFNPDNVCPEIQQDKVIVLVHGVPIAKYSEVFQQFQSHNWRGFITNTSGENAYNGLPEYFREEVSDFNNEP